MGNSDFHTLMQTSAGGLWGESDMLAVAATFKIIIIALISGGSRRELKGTRSLPSNHNREQKATLEMRNFCTYLRGCVQLLKYSYVKFNFP